MINIGGIIWIIKNLLKPRLNIEKGLIVSIRISS